MRTGLTPAIFVILTTLLFAPTTDAAEIGFQAYATFQPEFSALFLSVRDWPLSRLGVAAGLGETIAGGTTRPSINTKVIWRLRTVGSMRLQSGVSLIASYVLDDSPMPHFRRTDLFWTSELAYWWPRIGRVAINVGVPLGWNSLTTAVGVSVHVAY